jgi:hypothetical protein
MQEKLAKGEGERDAASEEYARMNQADADE